MHAGLIKVPPDALLSIGRYFDIDFSKCLAWFSEMEEDEELARFLDMLLEDAQNNSSNLIPFTAEMSERLNQLLDGVQIDQDLC